jgi:hypothetical protein
MIEKQGRCVIQKGLGRCVMVGLGKKYVHGTNAREGGRNEGGTVNDRSLRDCSFLHQLETEKRQERKKKEVRFVPASNPDGALLSYFELSQPSGLL